MQEIPRALLLPPPSSLTQRTSARAVQSDSGIEAAHGARRQAQEATQGTIPAFLTLIDSRPGDTVEINGKQFRFRPYGNRGPTADGGAREAELAGGAGTASSDDDVSVDALDSFGAGARERNSSAFIASFIAQERCARACTIRSSKPPPTPIAAPADRRRRSTTSRASSASQSNPAEEWRADRARLTELGPAA